MKTALLAALVLLTGCVTAPPKAVDAPQPAKIQQATPAQVAAVMQLLGIVPRSTSEWKRFDTLHEAAVAGAQRLVECSVYYECGGHIYKHEGKFVMGPVHSNYASNTVTIPDDGPTGWETAADIHSHPCAPKNVTQVFSPEDMIGAIVYRIPVAYMLDMCTGDVHEFIPNVTKIDEEQIDGEVWLSQGKIIGHIPPAKMPLAKEGV